MNDDCTIASDCESYYQQICFRAAWKLMAQIGACDSVDGAEYERVYAEWRAAGEPLKGLCQWIVSRANK